MSNTTPAVGDRVRFIEDYPRSGEHARKGDEGTVVSVRPRTYYTSSPLVTVDLDGKGRIPAAYARRMEVVPPAPVFAKGDEVRVVEATYRVSSGTVTRHHTNASDLVGMVGQVYDGEPDADGDIEVEFPDGTTTPFDPAGLVHVVAEPVALALNVGDRAVVESPVFSKPGGEYGDHSILGDGNRPKVGEVVVIARTGSYLGDYETATGWRIAPEGLVPAPKFLPGDRVTIVASTYVGTYRKAGNVGTVVETPTGFPHIRGIARPDYAVSLDAEHSSRKVWGYRESELALYVEPVAPEAPAYVPAEGDRVTVVGKDFLGDTHHLGKTGRVASGADADGDFRVVFDGGLANYFAPASLAKADEPLAEWERELYASAAESYAVPTTFVAGIEPTFAIVDETAPAQAEDYLRRLEVSERAAKIIASEGGSVTGSGVRDLAEFLLGA